MNLWWTHAILGFVAWGVLAPAGTLLSLFRKVLFRDNQIPLWDRHDNPDDLRGRTWVKLHRYLGETVILLTWILFGIAIFGVRQGHPTRNLHRFVGIAVFLLTFPTWLLGRVLMPPMVPRTNGNRNSSGSISAEQTWLITRSGDETSPGNGLSSPMEQLLIRTHRILGGSMLAAGLWEIHSGLSLFVKKWEFNIDLIRAYYVWCGFLMSLLLILAIGQRLNRYAPTSRQ